MKKLIVFLTLVIIILTACEKIPVNKEGTQLEESGPPVQPQKETKKMAGTMSRVVSSTNVQPSSTFTVKYQLGSGVSPYYYIIRDTISSGGCTFVGTVDPKVLPTTLSNPATETVAFTVNAPSSTGSCTLSGFYKLGNSPNVDFSPDIVVTIGETKKMAGSMTRAFSPNPAGINTNIDITYTSSSNGFNGIEDTVPSGFTLVTQSSLVSLINNKLRAAWTGSSITITLKSPPTEGTYSFSGTFEGTGDINGVIAGDSSIIISNVQNQASGEVKRTLPSSASPNQNVNIVLTAQNTEGDFFAITRDNIPNGWSYVSGGSLEGYQVKGILSTLTGNSMTYTLKAQSSPGTATFSGTYQFTGAETPLTIIGDNSITVSNTGKTQYTATRTFNAYTVSPGGKITATYTPQIFNYFAIIEDVPSGWSLDKTISPDGKVRTTADGTVITIQWTAPMVVGSYTFNGQYFVNPDVTYSNFAPNQVVVS